MTTQGSTSPMTVDRSKWGWFVLLGIALLVLGVIAAGNVLVATAVSVFFVGAMMIVAGIAQIIHAFGVKNWGTFIWWLLGGILYVIAGWLAFYNPMLVAGAMTLFLAIFLIASGFARIWIGISAKGLEGRGWITIGGVVTALAGAIIAIGWPTNSLWILGLFLAIDLIFQGISYVALGFAIRQQA